MEFALSTDSTEASGLSLLRRLWVCRFDVEEEGRTLAEKYVLCAHSPLKLITHRISVFFIFSNSTVHVYLFFCSPNHIPVPLYEIFTTFKNVLSCKIRFLHS